MGVLRCNPTEERLARSPVQRELGLFSGGRWGVVAMGVLGSPPLCDPGHDVQGPLQLAPTAAVLGCVFASCHLCVFSLSSVISMRCMVQFVGREAKYRWVILGTERHGHSSPHSESTRTGHAGPVTVPSLPWL